MIFRLYQKIIELLNKNLNDKNCNWFQMSCCWIFFWYDIFSIIKWLFKWFRNNDLEFFKRKRWRIYLDWTWWRYLILISSKLINVFFHSNDRSYHFDKDELKMKISIVFEKKDIVQIIGTREIASSEQSIFILLHAFIISAWVYFVWIFSFKKNYVIKQIVSSLQMTTK